MHGYNDHEVTSIVDILAMLLYYSVLHIAKIQKFAVALNE